MAELQVPWKRRRLNIAYWLTAVCFAGFMLESQNPEWYLRSFAFDPQEALQGLQLWRFLSYAFFFGSPLNFIFAVLMYWILGSALESLWGSAQFLIFLLVSLIGVSAMAAILGQPAMGPSGLYFNLLVLYAIHFPDAVFFIFFVIPVKVRWLAILAALGLIASSIFTHQIAMMIGTASGFIYWGLRLRSGRVVRVARTRVKAAAGALIPRRDPRQEALAALQVARQIAERAGGGTPAAEDQEILEGLKARVHPAVNVCPPDYFDPQSEHCPACNGFLECALRSTGLLALPARKAGGTTATGAADAIAASAAREREKKARERRAPSTRPIAQNP